MAQVERLRLNWVSVPPRDWAEEQTYRIAMEVKRLRDDKSAQWLSDRTKALGAEISRAVISDLETGRRRYVTTAELIVLARALNTVPVSLLYPPPYDSAIQILPNAENDVSALFAAQWFSGLLSPFETRMLVGGEHEELDRNIAPLRNSREIFELEERLIEMLRMQPTARDTVVAGALESQIASVNSRLRELKRGFDGG
ncbi:hypothetical protein ABIA30_003129 [Mycobacterium sp. MAA66]|uniref:hypothetical protein n=1 Tax=Mycobacterium sp. MAA66 TaxID=3156297 RepID=UPI0035188EA0